MRHRNDVFYSLYNARIYFELESIWNAGRLSLSVTTKSHLNTNEKEHLLDFKIFLRILRFGRKMLNISFSLYKHTECGACCFVCERKKNKRRGKTNVANDCHHWQSNEIHFILAEYLREEKRKHFQIHVRKNKIPIFFSLFGCINNASLLFANVLWSTKHLIYASQTQFTLKFSYFLKSFYGALNITHFFCITRENCLHSRRQNCVPKNAFHSNQI